MLASAMFTNEITVTHSALILPDTMLTVHNVGHTIWAHVPFATMLITERLGAAFYAVVYNLAVIAPSMPHLIGQLSLQLYL